MMERTILHYKIIEKLGEGGMGEVYKARDTQLDRTVALKFLSDRLISSDEERQRFIREAKAAAGLNDPNICTIYSVEEREGQHFISMEYVEGSTLREIIKDGGLDTEKAVDYAIQIASALAAAHEKGIVHRDLKPENIIVNENDRIKVMDFGLAQVKGERHITRKGQRLGTAAYMSPEQARGEEVDVRSDLFSLGIILYELLSGQHPFDGEYEQAIIYRLLNEEPQEELLLKSGARELTDLVMCCLQKKPEERYNSAMDVYKELRDYKGFSTSNGLISNIFTSPFSEKGRMKRLVTGFLVLLVLLAGVWLYRTGWLISAGWEDIPEEKHLVVLPFNNLSEEEIPASFNDGIMEILTSKITQMGSKKGSLWVVPNSEVRSENVSSVKEARRLFAANLAVTGSLQRVGDQLRLTINLVDGSTMRQLRSTVVELEWTNFSQMQDKVVRALADLLEIDISPKTKSSLIADNSLDSRAYQLFVEARGFLSRYEDPEALNTAIEKFNAALEVDSGYARAWAGLGEAYWHKFQLNNDVQMAKRALKYTRKSLELNDQLSDVQVTLAMIYNGMGRSEEALKLLENLENQKEPGYEARIQYAKAYSGLGRTKRAEEEYLKAIDLKKTYWDGYKQLGTFYYRQGRYKEAVEMFKKVTEWTPDSYSAFYRLGAGYFAMKQNRKAEKAFKKSLELRSNYRAYSNLGTLYFYEGKYSEAIRMYEQALELNDTDYRIWGNLGFAYYWSGASKEKIRSTLHEAIKRAEKLHEVTPGNNKLLAQLANYYALTGNREQVHYLLGQLISKDLQDPEVKVIIADVYETLDERKAAIAWIENALEGGYAWEHLQSRPGLSKLMEDPRMQKLQESYN